MSETILKVEDLYKKFTKPLKRSMFYGTADMYRRIKTWLKEYPEIIVNMDELSDLIKADIILNDKDISNFSDNVGDNVGDNLSVNQIGIIKQIKENKNISAREMAGVIGISQRKIEENISKLKIMGILKREGSAKAGFWLVNKAKF